MAHDRSVWQMPAGWCGSFLPWDLTQFSIS